VKREELLNLTRREARLAHFGEAITDKVDRLVGHIHRSRRDRIESMRLTTNHDSRHDEHNDRGKNNEYNDHKVKLSTSWSMHASRSEALPAHRHRQSASSPDLVPHERH